MHKRTSEGRSREVWERDFHAKVERCARLVAKGFLPGTHPFALCLINFGLRPSTIFFVIGSC